MLLDVNSPTLGSSARLEKSRLWLSLASRIRALAEKNHGEGLDKGRLLGGEKDPEVAVVVGDRRSRLIDSGGACPRVTAGGGTMGIAGRDSTLGGAR